MAILKDLKEAISGGRKPDTTHVRKAVKYYIARACEYGSDKYERANFMRPLEGTTEQKVDALRVYARAAGDHIGDFLESLEKHQSNDPHFEDTEGLRAAMYCEDTDAKPGCTVGASGLPHLAHAAASLMMLITKLVSDGWLPLDPGQPWRNREAFDPSNVKLTFDGVELKGFVEGTIIDSRETVQDVVAEASQQVALMNEPFSSSGAKPLPEPYKCQHGTGLGMYCTGCQNPVRQPPTG